MMTFLTFEENKMFHVYSKPQCTFCDQAKALLHMKELPFQEFVLDVGQTKVAGVTYVSREEVLGRFPGARTMPQIALVKDGNFQPVGGYTELKALT
jgi:glutaredoxin